MSLKDILKESKGGKKVLEIDLGLKDEVNLANMRTVEESEFKEDIIGYVLELSTASYKVKDDDY